MTMRAEPEWYAPGGRLRPIWAWLAAFVLLLLAGMGLIRQGLFGYALAGLGLLATFTLVGWVAVSLVGYFHTAMMGPREPDQAPDYRDYLCGRGQP